MNFKRIPYLYLIALIMEKALKIPKAPADELRSKVKHALGESKPRKPNI